MRVLAAILWKDLVTEWRSRDRVVAMTVFAFLVVVVFQFAWPESEPAETRRFAPGCAASSRAAAASKAGTTTSTFITRPGPPPDGVSSTFLCLSCA